MKDGDIYRWSYKQHVIDKSQDSVRAGTLYWCCSRIAIFSDGKLRDTYWLARDGRVWSEETAIKDLELTYIANQEELEQCKYPQFYENVIDLTHPNSYGKLVYIKKGQKRSKKVMMALVMNEMENNLAKIESLYRRIDILEKKLDEVNNSEDLEKVWI